MTMMTVVAAAATTAIPAAATAAIPATVNATKKPFLCASAHCQYYESIHIAYEWLYILNVNEQIFILILSVVEINWNG